MVSPIRMPPLIRRTLLTALCSTVFIGAGSASAATQWVALTGSVGANTSCASPGFIGAASGVDNAIAAATAGDTIHLCPGTWATIDTGNDGFWTDKSLVFEGSGESATTVDGSGSTSPAIFLNAGSSDTLKVRDLTVQDAISEGPGAIYSSGPLTIEDVTVRNSGGLTSAVGSDVDGVPVTIRRSTLIGQEPGVEYPAPLVYSQGSVTVEDSTFRDNTWAYGTLGSGPPFPGILLNVPSTDYDLSIDSSTFSGLDGGCASSVGTNTDVSITNSTFTGNIAGNYECYSTHINVTGSLTMKSSTFAGNTGVRDSGYGDSELLSSTSITLGNNIIVGDPNAEATCQVSGITATNDGGNVISDGTVGCDDFVGGASPSLQAKVLESAIDLGPLADNGGPTETMALGAASVARGAAISAECPEDDQRGVIRGTPCTSGAWQEGLPSGKPTVKQKGRAGKDSLTVRVRCADSGPCRIRLSGVLKGGKGKLKSKTVKVRAGGKTVELPYTSLLERELRSKGGSGSVRVRAKEIGGGSASTLVRVTLPDPVTG